jgi:hypothetical protein
VPIDPPPRPRFARLLSLEGRHGVNRLCDDPDAIAAVVLNDDQLNHRPPRKLSAA